MKHELPDAHHRHFPEPGQQSKPERKPEDRDGRCMVHCGFVVANCGQEISGAWAVSVNAFDRNPTRSSGRTRPGRGRPFRSGRHQLVESRTWDLPISSWEILVRPGFSRFRGATFQVVTFGHKDFGWVNRPVESMHGSCKPAAPPGPDAGQPTV